MSKEQKVRSGEQKTKSNDRAQIHPTRSAMAMNRIIRATSSERSTPITKPPCHWTATKRSNVAPNVEVDNGGVKVVAHIGQVEFATREDAKTLTNVSKTIGQVGQVIQRSKIHASKRCEKRRRKDRPTKHHLGFNRTRKRLVHSFRPRAGICKCLITFM